jgi:hypothetical protein
VKLIKFLLNSLGLRHPTGVLQYDDYHRSIHGMDASNDLIAAAIAGNNPAPIAISRLGSVELSCLEYYVSRRMYLRKMPSYPSRIRISMKRQAGFFSNSDNLLDKFSRLYLDCLTNIDVLGVWFNRFENEVAKNYATTAHLVPLQALEPYYHQNPWSFKLEGKKVLVIHPFSETIKNQFVHRDKLFKNHNVLPEFDLIVQKSVQSLDSNANDEYIDWFAALDEMTEQMLLQDFDVAIVGCGAYGLPLAVRAKRAGKVAIHLGGATQTLFGIKGARWDKHPFISSLYNDHWTRASDAERPKDYLRVEGGSYW